jgi:RecJ-like exonuclease
MKCTECKGKGTKVYGDERLLCVVCHGSGVVSQAVQFNINREYKDKGWTRL